MSGNTPCMNCENRKVGCHATCEAFKSWKEERDALFARTRQERYKDRDICSYIDERQRKLQKNKYGKPRG